MKIKNNALGLLASILLGAAASASAAPVTFNVNMSVQAALGNFNPANGDTVLVAGNWDGWATTNVMTLTATPNVYAFTTNLTGGSYPNYEFVIDPGGDSSGNTLQWEVPASFGGGDRWFEVPAGGTNLPTVYFSDDANVPTYPVQITFQVNMAPAIAQNIFTIGSDYVDVFGSFNNWASTGVLLTNVPGTSNYVGTLVTTSLTTNDTLVNYKYAIDGSGGTWEGNVGANGAANRALYVTNAAQVLPPDSWDNITNLNVSYNVQFEVNMIVEDALGNFNAGSDSVYVAGDWNWNSTALQLTPSDNIYVYTGAVAMVYSPGTVVDYKYVINGYTWENNGVGPGGANNHQLTLAGNTNLPTDYFDDYSDLGPLTVAASGTQMGLTWASGTNANNNIWLQASTNLSSGWTNVDNTQGQSAFTNDFGPGPVFFRLTGP